jgi:hypothetical protein
MNWITSDDIPDWIDLEGRSSVVEVAADSDGARTEASSDGGGAIEGGGGMINSERLFSSLQEAKVFAFPPDHPSLASNIWNKSKAFSQHESEQ